MNQKERSALFKDIEGFRAELRPIEDICYLEHKYNDQLISLAKKYNLLGIPVDKKFGGRNATNLEYAQALDQIAREGTGIRTFFSGHSSLGQKVIMRFGTEQQKKNLLSASIQAKNIFAFALTEPEAGSDPLGMQMSFTEKNGAYVLNGTKYLISNAGIADSIITFAKSSDGRISAFIVDAKLKGINREDLHAKMGMPTNNTAMFELENYRLPKENLLGKKGDGWNIAKHALMEGRLSVAAGCCGVMADCLDEALTYATQRVQHKKLIGKHQLVQEHLARMQLSLQSSRLMVERAARLKDAYDENSSLQNMAAADQAIAEAKLFAAHASWDAADCAVQVIGGRGWSFIFRSGRHLVDTRVCRIYEGTDEILKLKIAAGMLGKDFEAYS